MKLACQILVLCLFLACTHACMDSCDSCSTGGCRSCKDTCISDCCETTDCHTSTNCETDCHDTCRDSCRRNCCDSCNSCRNTCRDTCRQTTCDCERRCCDKDCHDHESKEKTSHEHHTSEEHHTSRKDSKTETRVDTDSINTNINNIANVMNFTNTLNTVNKIYLPINITTTNINNVNVDTSCSGGSTTEHCDNRTEIIDRTRINSTTVPVYIRVPYPVPVYLRVPVPVPVPVRIPVAVPVPIPYPVPQPSGCCVVVIPCVTFRCSPYNRVCGNDCLHPFMFSPRNPCGMGGCQRRNNWNRMWCQGHGNCQMAATDCGGCGSDFYSDYHSYMGCRGCFY